MELTNLNHIKTLLSRHGFHFSKRMGQNFLIADWVPRDIAHACGAGAGDGVVEVGPGIGSLTIALAQRAEQVVAVELDRTLLPILQETLAPYPNTEVVSGDVMELDLAALAAEKLAGLRPFVCANLPYNITTPVLTKFLEAGCFESITVMIQREVARRICARPATPDYGAFSLFCQYHAHCELLFDVPPDCFLPAPKVTSSVIRLVPRHMPPVEAPPDILFPLIRAAFAQRRKTLLNGLRAAYACRSREALCGLLGECGLPDTVRGEQLSLEQFSLLALRLTKI